jgi:DNA polymerase I-like protein with 3'-5' exonuclease and polymerase domains
MKQALVLFHSYLTSNEIPAKIVANVHDEWQVEVKAEYAEEVGKLGVKAIQDAGVVLGLRCPLTGEYKIGNNWAETH